MCECLKTMAGYYPDSFGNHHHKECPRYKKDKYPYLFYYEDGVNAFIPVPDKVQEIIDIEHSIDKDEELEVRFKRFDMTDEEIDLLPVE